MEFVILRGVFTFVVDQKAAIDEAAFGWIIA